MSLKLSTRLASTRYAGVRAALAGSICVLSVLVLGTSASTAAAPQPLYERRNAQQAPPTLKQQLFKKAEAASANNDTKAWRSIYAQLLPLVQGSDPEDEQDRADVLRVLGYFDFLDGDFDAADKKLQEALPLLEQYYAADPNLVIQCLALLTLDRLMKADLAQARALLARVDKWSRSESSLSPQNKGLLGEASIRLNEVEQGARYLLDAQTFYQEHHQDRGSRYELRRITYWLSKARMRQNRLPEALALAQAALKQSEENGGGLDVALANQSIGLIHLKAGRHKEAEFYLNRALPYLAKDPKTGSDLHVAKLAVAQALTGQGQIEGALAQLEPQLALDGDAFGRDSMQVAETAELLGELYHGQNRYRAAADALTRAHAIEVAQSSTPTAELALLTLKIGNAYWSTGLFCRSRDWYGQAQGLARQLNDKKLLATSEKGLTALRDRCRTGTIVAVDDLPAMEYIYVASPMDGDLLDLVNSALSAQLAVGRFEDAERNYREGAELAQRLNDEKTQAYALARLAEVQVTTGRATAGVAPARQALAITERLYPAVSKARFDRHRVLAQALNYSENVPEARMQTLLAADLLRRNPNLLPDDELPVQQLAVGMLLTDLVEPRRREAISVGDPSHALARDFLLLAQRYFQQRNNKTSVYQLSQCEQWLGQLDLYEGNYPEAERHARLGIQHERESGAKVGDVGQWFLLGTALLQQEKFDDALTALQEADRILQSQPHNPQYARVQLNIAIAWAKKDNWKAAEDKAQKVIDGYHVQRTLSMGEIGKAWLILGRSQTKHNHPELAAPFLQYAYDLFLQGGATGETLTVGKYLFEAQMAAGQSCAGQATLASMLTLAETQNANSGIESLKATLSQSRAAHACSNTAQPARTLVP